METLNNLISLEELNSGNVECISCHKGYYKPFNPEFETNHYFTCDNCGESMKVEPNIEID